MTTIKLKNGSGAPTAGDLAQGEPALDLTNKRLYTEDSGGTVIEVGTNPGVDVTFADNRKAVFGAGSDLQIYHDGTDSIINEGTAGNLLVQGATIKLQTANGAKDYLVATPSAEITLYHNNTARLATTATGIDVSGTATMDGLTVDGSATITQSAGSDFLKFDVDGTTDEAILGINSTDFIIDIDPTNVRASSNFVVKNDGTTNLTLNSSGDLDVNGAVTADGLTVDGATDGTAVALFRADNNGVTKKNTLRFEDTDTTTQNDQQIGRIEFYSNDTEHTGVDAVIEAVSATTALKELRFLTSDTANTPLSRLAINKSGDISFYEDTGTTAKLFWDASAESLGIGTSSPSGLLHIASTGASNIKLEDTDNGFAATELNVENGGRDFKITTPQDTIFVQGSTEAMRILDGGNLLVGKTVTTYTTDGFRASNIGFGASRTSGTVADMNRNGTDGNIFAFYKAGTIVGSISVTSSATAYNTSSDQRLKDNIVDAPSASDDIDAIQVRSFDWKADGSHQKYGMVAQELQGVAPEAVSGDADSDDMMGVDYSKLVPMMLKEIQSLRARVAQLEGVN